jgi:hypothetical protein
MVSLNDEFWDHLTGGYKTRFDPRSHFARLEAGEDVENIWHELWEELHHQGDIGTASYAAVPHLVMIYKKLGTLDWNPYAIVAVIELARTEGQNPELPKFLEMDYFRAIQELAEIGTREVSRAVEPGLVRVMLSIIAIAKGLRTHGRFLIKYSEDELLKIEQT